jgi:hypothetical protein
MKKKFIPFLASVFLLGSLAPMTSNAAESLYSVQSVQARDLTPQELSVDKKIFEQSESLFGAIENIPDSVVEQGPQATAQWLQNETGYIVTVDSQETLRFSETSSTELVDNQEGIDPNTPAKFLKPTDPSTV